jgi:hypothetical protein
MPIQLNANIERTIAAANVTGSRSFCLLFYGLDQNRITGRRKASSLA